MPDGYEPSPLDGVLLAMIAESVASVHAYFGRGAIPAGGELATHDNSELRRWLERDKRRWGRRAQHQLRPWEDVCLFSHMEQAEEA